MSNALELVYQYRHLLGKCEAGTGLSMEEIDALQTIESVFAKYGHPKVDLAAELRGNRLADDVRIVDLRSHCMVVRGAPYAEKGQTVEIVVRDHELSLSYRFKAVVAWLRDDANDDFYLGLELVGTPVLVRHHQSSDTGERHLADARAAA